MRQDAGISAFVLFVLLQVFVTPLLAEPNVGRVVFLRGSVSATDDVTGLPRTLSRDSRVEAGETIKTGPSGVVQLVFPDKSMLHIKPESVVKLEKYRFTQKGSKNDGMVTTIIKGSLRSLTGALGKRNKKSVQFNTSVATIGIRGTALELRQSKDGWAVTFDYGSGFMKTDGGDVNVETGESARADSGKQKAAKFPFERPANDPARVAKRLVEAPDSDIKKQTQEVCKRLTTEDAGLLLGMESQVPGFKPKVINSTVEGLVVCFPLNEFRTLVTSSTLLYSDQAADILKAAVRGGLKPGPALESVMRGMESPSDKALESVINAALDTGLSKEGAEQVFKNLQDQGICL